MSDKQPQSQPLPSKPSKQAFEQWLRDEVVSAYQQLKADPAWDMSIDDVRTALAKRRQKSF